ncbi:transposable element Tcb1 transposase [Trichonephila clavipes]|nr:transposable element Tcb1 transposase [Trichonephila clavipes]
MRAFGEGPLNFEPWSSDEDNTCALTPSPNFYTTPTGGRLSLDKITCIDLLCTVGLLREIGSRVGRNQTTLMPICDRWMREGTTNRRGQSHPPQCTTSPEDRQIVRMAVTDRSVTSRTVAQHIESVTHHSVSARTIRRRLQQSGLSARHPLLGLPLTQNHRRLRR